VSIFSQLRIHPNADAWWVVVLGGHDTLTGDLVEFHLMLGHNHRAVVNGAVIHYRDGWVDGSPVKWVEAIARSEGNSDRSFWGTTSSRAGEHRWKFRPDAAMTRRLKSVELDEKFHLCGWGPGQIDGSAFDWDDRDIPVRGIITDTRALQGGHVIEVTYRDEELDLDEPLQLNKFGGYDIGRTGFTPGGSDDQQGNWLETSATTAFDVDGSAPGFPGYTFTWIGVADDIPSPQFTSDGIIVLSGDQTSITTCSWGLLLAALGDLTLIAKAERFATGFIPPRNGWFSVHMVIETDGETVNVYAGEGRAAGNVSLVGSFTLAAKVSAAGGTARLTIGSPFLGPSFITAGPPWGIITAEARTHNDAFTLATINMRRARSWAATEAIRPEHLWRFATPFAGSVDEDGGVDLAALSEITPSRRVSVGDGPLTENANGIVGRTIPISYGRADNVPTTDSGAEFDSKIITEVLFKVHEIRSKQAPMTWDVVKEGNFDFDNTTDEITISAGQPELSFVDILEPDGDLPGQSIELIFAGGEPNGIFTVEDISDDNQVLTTVEGLGGPAPPNLNNPGTIRTPITGAGKFAAEIVEELGIAVLDRGEIPDLGRITVTASGYQGTTGEEESQLGLFKAVLERRFGFTGVVTEESSFLNLAPVGLSTELGGSISTRKFLNTLLIPNGFQWVPDTESFRIFGYQLPGVPDDEINEFDHAGVSTISMSRELRSISLLYAKNDSPQDRDAAVTAVPEVNRARWEAPGQTVTRDNANASERAVDLADPIPSAIQERAEADAAIDKMASLIFADREWTKVPVVTMRLYETVTGDTVRVFSLDPIKGWQAGQDSVVESIEFSTDDTMLFEVMSLAESQTLTLNGEPVTLNGEFLNL
jgi:hypothetical protein